MSTSNLMSLPVDIAWRRLAFSPDMFDTDFHNINLPPKWHSSLAAFYYVVPEETTAEMYPDQKVVYIKVSCSITGLNLKEELIGSVDVEQITAGDNVQRSVWEALKGGYWASHYLPCYGAILQVAVYPRDGGGADLWDYPYFIDFEPKKREMYETRTETGEVLSGSTDDLNVKKGATSTSSTEESDILTGVDVSASAFWGLASASTKVTGEWGTRQKTGSEETNVTQTNLSQQRRETLSASTTISQMYQLFNGYHLGTNRALFFMLPRPHTTQDNDVLNPNLINGPRKLEGIQEVFLVMAMPKDASGFCFQANLETAHPETEPLEGVASTHLLRTRRRIESCAQISPIFGVLHMQALDLNGLNWFQTYGLAPAVGSVELAQAVPTFQESVMEQPASQHRLANTFNSFLQGTVQNAMLQAYSGDSQNLRPIGESEPVRRAVSQALRSSTLDIAVLADAGYMTSAEAQRWSDLGLRRVSEFFVSERPTQPEVQTARESIVDRVVAMFRRPPIG